MKEIIFDPWTSISFKRSLGEKSVPGVSWTVPLWVGDHQRRLTAYKILQAYIDNAARYFLATNDEEARGDHREYGDAALIVEQVRSAAMGDDYELVVEGAERFNPDLEAEFDDEGNPLNDDEVLANQEASAAFALQQWAQEWADTERFQLKLLETEKNAVGLGDGVYVLGWSSSKGRPRLRVFDPGFYFPVLDDGNEDEFPRRVHIAWEVPTDDASLKIRRITWELGLIRPASEPGILGKFNGEQTALFDGDFFDEDGYILRQYPWNEDPSNITCYLTDAVFTIDKGKKSTGIDDLLGSVTYMTNEEGEEIKELDLGIDFIPIVHLPNTVAVLNHYGKSSLATVLQILDDIANADTDLSNAAATTGQPVLALSGAYLEEGEPLTYKPGHVFQTGDGNLNALDTSKSLDALLKYLESLLFRLSINSRLPESVLGRVKPSEVPSGVALALSFGPLISMVREMRLVRKEKYMLLFKFAQRISVAGGGDAPQEWMPIQLEFGNYLPIDRNQVLNEVQQLFTARAISPETAIRMLQIAGFPIEDAIEEVRRLESRDFEGAVKLRHATEDPGVVMDYLHREASERSELPSFTGE